MLGLGPVGQFAARIAGTSAWSASSASTRCPNGGPRRRFGIETVDPNDRRHRWRLIELTGGRGPDAVIDAVGMEAHGHGRGLEQAGRVARATGLLPDPLAQTITDVARSTGLTR